MIISRYQPAPSNPKRPGTVLRAKCLHVSPITLAVLALMSVGGYTQPVQAVTQAITGGQNVSVSTATGDDYTINDGTLNLLPGAEVGHRSTSVFDYSITSENGGGLLMGAGSTVLGGINATNSTLGVSGGSIDTGLSDISLRSSVATFDQVSVIKHGGNLNENAVGLYGSSILTTGPGTTIQVDSDSSAMGVGVQGQSTFIANNTTIHGGWDGIEISTCAGGCTVILNGGEVTGSNAGMAVIGNNDANDFFDINGTTLAGNAALQGDITSADDSRGDGLLIFSGTGTVNGVVRGGAKLVGNGATGSGMEVSYEQVATAASQPVTVQVSDASISGKLNGIRFRPDDSTVDPTSYLANATNIVLDGNTTVHGGTGAAIDATGGTSTVTATGNTVLSSDAGVLLATHAGTSFQLNLENLNAIQYGDLVNTGGVSNVLLQNARLQGGATNVSSMTVNQGGDWALTKSSTVDNLTMHGGVVNLNGTVGQQQNLTVGQLSGNGAFSMSTDVTNTISDQLIVTGAGKATGAYTMAFADKGTNPQSSGAIDVVKTNGGGATFTLANNQGVNLGTYQYALVQNGNNWALQPTKRLTPYANAVLNAVAATPTVWYGQLTPMLARLGELNYSQQQGGAWVRPYGSRMRVKASAGSAFDQDQSGVAIGADKRFAQVLGGDLFVGGVFNYSHSTLNDEYDAQGKIDAYSVGAYAAWMGPLGYYLHGLVNFNRYVNTTAVATRTGNSNGSANTNGVGLVLEGGKRFNLPLQVFVQPYLQFSGLHMQGQDYHLTNGMYGTNNRTNSLQTAVGATIGKTLESASGGVAEPYLRVAFVHEFVNGNDVIINGSPFNPNLSGSRVEAGGGVAWKMGARLSANFDYTYAKGNKLTQPFALNAGLRYSW